MRYFGAHLGGGIKRVGEVSAVNNINTIQYMPTPPMRWSAKDISQEAVAEFVTMQKNSPIQKVLLHAIYLINLARGDSQMFHLSKLSLKSYLDYQAAVEAEMLKQSTQFEVLGTCVHCGSAKDLSEADSLLRVIEGINWVLEHSPKGTILLESTAGSGAVMGDTFEELAKMRDGVGQKSRVGFVLDTQHTFSSGYDWRIDLNTIVDKIDSILGLENVKCFHLNDSLVDFGSHKDRHANLGEGKIGLDAITALINHPKLKAIPFILETPNLKDDEGIAKEMIKLSNIMHE